MYICHIYRKKTQKLIRIVKTNNSINCSKQRKRRVVISCSKTLPTLSRVITSKHHDNFYYSNCLNSFGTENKLKSHGKIFRNKSFCGILMPSEKDNKLEFKLYIKSDKMLYLINADIESLIIKIDGWANNSEKSSATNIGDHIPCGKVMSTIRGFDHIENKGTLYRGKKSRKNFVLLYQSTMKI